MAADEQILVAGTSAVPVVYMVPNAIEAALLCVNATINGASAASAFLATVEIWSDGGVCVARCPCFTTIAAGGSAEISWFRLRNQQAAVTATSPYELAVLHPGGLVLYWKFDESAGALTAIDSSGNGRSGDQAASGMTTGVAGLADGNANTYARSGFFGHNWDGGPNATTQYRGTFTQTTEVSAVLWIKTTQAGGGRPYVFNSSGGNTSVPFADLVINAGGTIDWVIQAPGSSHTLTGVTVVNDGVKHMIAGIYDGVTMELYVDNVLDASVAMGLGLDTLTGGGITIVCNGRRIGDQIWDNGYTGTADEVAFYTLALTAAEISAMFTAANP